MRPTWPRRSAGWNWRRRSTRKRAQAVRVAAGERTGVAYGVCTAGGPSSQAAGVEPAGEAEQGDQAPNASRDAVPERIRLASPGERGSDGNQRGVGNRENIPA